MWKEKGIALKPTHHYMSRTWLGTKGRTGHDTGRTKSQDGGQAFTCMVLRQTTKFVKACQMASGLVWRGGKNDLRDRFQETREVFPNIFPATDCEIICNNLPLMHFHKAFTESGHLSLLAVVFERTLFKFLALQSFS